MYFLLEVRHKQRLRSMTKGIFITTSIIYIHSLSYSATHKQRPTTAVHKAVAEQDVQRAQATV